MPGKPRTRRNVHSYVHAIEPVCHVSAFQQPSPPVFPSLSVWWTDWQREQAWQGGVSRVLPASPRIVNRWNWGDARTRNSGKKWTCKPLVMKRSSVRFRQAAPHRDPGSPAQTCGARRVSLIPGPARAWLASPGVPPLVQPVQCGLICGRSEVVKISLRGGQIGMSQPRLDRGGRDPGFEPQTRCRVPQVVQPTAPPGLLPVGRSLESGGIEPTVVLASDEQVAGRGRTSVAWCRCLRAVHGGRSVGARALRRSRRLAPHATPTNGGRSIPQAKRRRQRRG